jgi:hypothetical protein
MTNSISDLMTQYHTALKSIQGGHSCASFEYDYYVADEIKVAPMQEGFESNFSWLDLSKVPETYHIECIWKAISPQTLPTQIAQSMEAAWAFQKLFGTFNSSMFPEAIEQEVFELIEQTQQVLTDIASNFIVCQAMSLNLGCNDYQAFTASSRSEIFTFEFMHFID